MITIENVRDFPPSARGAFVTIGNFDGVHRGHGRLIAELRRRADAAGVPALAVTFDPHPVALLRPDKAPVPLVWQGREYELLKAAGASEVAVFRTGPWLLELSAREFFERVILDQFAARGLVERVTTDLDVFEATSRPPQTTRARLRGEFVRAAQEARRDYTVDWVHLKLNDQAQRTVLCKDPFRAVDERVDRLIESM